MTKKHKSPSPVAVPTPKTFWEKENRLFWILVAVSFLLYSASISFSYVLDDVAVIEQNKFVQEGFGGIGKILTTFYWQGYWDQNAGLYRPLSLVTYAIEWGISPNNPSLSHFINVLLYAFCCGLIFRLCRKIFTGFPTYISFIIALIFAVHPIHSEVVANIKSRDELLSLFFFLSMMLELVKSSWTVRTFVWSSVCLLLALLSKEAAILYVPVAAVYLFLYRKAERKHIVQMLSVLAVVAGVWLILFQSVIHSASSEPTPYSYRDNSMVLCSKSDQIATGIGLFGKYVEKTVVPVRLTYDYSFNEIPCQSFTSPVVWIIVLVTSAIAVLLWRKRKTRPELLFSFLFFVITMALGTNVFFLIGTTFAERLAFTPSLGLISLLVLGGYLIHQRWLKSSIRFDIGFTALVAVLFTVATYNRTQAWESDERLFEEAVKTGSSSARVHANYGTSLMKQAEAANNDKELFEKSIEQLKYSASIDAAEPGTFVNLGVCYFRIGEYEKSAAATTRALSLSPKDTTLFFNLADAYYNLDNMQKAEQWYLKGIETNKTKLGDYERLGSIYFNKGEFPEALRIYQLGLKRLPANESLLMNSGNCYGALEKYREAAETFYAAYQQNPSNGKALEMLRMSEAKGGFHLEK